jgi:hypothetical protein
MGCGNTKTVPVTKQENDYDLQQSIDRVQRTWPTVKKIDNLGPKVFAQYVNLFFILNLILKKFI